MSQQGGIAMDEHDHRYRRSSVGARSRHGGGSGVEAEQEWRRERERQLEQQSQWELEHWRHREQLRPQEHQFRGPHQPPILEPAEGRHGFPQGGGRPSPLSTGSSCTCTRVPG